MQYEVDFIEVGRDKRSWCSTFSQEPTSPMLERVIRKNVRIASSELEAVYLTDVSGSILVGGFRQIGTFLVRSA
jgi:hypothetical protein